MIRLGDLEVPRIGLGTNRLTNTPENVSLIRAAVAAGVRMIDTAHLYTRGESETTIGAALSPVPDGCVVATKGGFSRGEGRPEVLRAQLADSLSRLRVEAVDLYYLHRVDPETPLDVSLTALGDLRDAGTIRHVGLSEVGVPEIERARRMLPIVAVQNRYNLSDRRHDAVVDYCAEEGIAFVPFYPLQGEGGGELARIARDHDATEAQIALAWLLRRSPAMLPIPGTLSLEHLHENLGARDIELTEDEYAALS